MTASNDILTGSSVQGQRLEGIIVNWKLWLLLDSGRNGSLLLSLLTEGFFFLLIYPPQLFRNAQVFT